MNDEKIIQIIPANSRMWVEAFIREYDEPNPKTSNNMPKLDESGHIIYWVHRLKVACLALTEEGLVYPMADWGDGMGVELITDDHRIVYKYGKDFLLCSDDTNLLYKDGELTEPNVIEDGKS